MDIENYYKNNAMIAFNASLVSTIPIFIFLFVCVVFKIDRFYLLYMLPFFIYSIISYVSFFLNNYKSNQVETTEVKTLPSSILQTKTVILSFLPAPSLRMAIFDGNGTIIGEIRDARFRSYRWYIPSFLEKAFPVTYGFYNTHNDAQYFYIRKKNSLEIRNRKAELISTINACKTDKVQITSYNYEEKKIFLKKRLAYADYSFLNKNGDCIASLQKGWMPKEWSTRFMNANMPIFTIDHSLCNRDIIHLYGILIYLYAYRDH